MAPLKDFGECVVTTGQTDYFFWLSFKAMSAIGEPGEIVQAFYDLHNDEVAQLLKRGLEAYGLPLAGCSHTPASLSYLNRQPMPR
ncbi:hypothetical protein CYR32_14915 [Chimaeribacter coloradensis]|uniref:Uncharacterized protein n=1 Tax=Chimaeribacter coloradensis TaxID=2060068 RepID=A0A2N5DYM5_9GAMM|nr:DUF6246 family protein [Chimaeribacter coloradensis]PLR32665.1 hypothetical protein CYR32_14915 [Chimaeribacter coloradensis]